MFCLMCSYVISSLCLTVQFCFSYIFLVLFQCVLLSGPGVSWCTVAFYCPFCDFINSSLLLDIAGSYKVRGILNQLRHFRRSQSMPTECPLVTLSAGNYGKAFAYLTSDFRRRLVLMPTTAPDDRQTVIEVAQLLFFYWFLIQCSIFQHSHKF